MLLAPEGMDDDFKDLALLLPCVVHVPMAIAYPPSPPLGNMATESLAFTHYPEQGPRQVLLTGVTWS